MRYNPFYELVEKRVLEWIAAAEGREVPVGAASEE
jgi:hypothetical protein